MYAHLLSHLIMPSRYTSNNNIMCKVVKESDTKKRQINTAGSAAVHNIQHMQRLPKKPVTSSVFHFVMENIRAQRLLQNGKKLFIVTRQF